MPWDCEYCGTENYSERVARKEPFCSRCNKQRGSLSRLIELDKNALLKLRESEHRYYREVCRYDKQIASLKEDLRQLQAKRDHAEAIRAGEADGIQLVESELKELLAIDPAKRPREVDPWQANLCPEADA